MAAKITKKAKSKEEEGSKFDSSFSILDRNGKQLNVRAASPLGDTTPRFLKSNNK